MSVANPLNWGGGVGTLHGQLLQRGALQRRRSFQCDQSSGCALACFAAPHEAHAGSRGRCNALRPVCLVGIQLSFRAMGDAAWRSVVSRRGRCSPCAPPLCGVWALPSHLSICRHGCSHGHRARVRVVWPRLCVDLLGCRCARSAAHGRFAGAVALVLGYRRLAHVCALLAGWSLHERSAT
ncbi:hypothetical protein D9M72_492380 [compost metagenome]